MFLDAAVGKDPCPRLRSSLKGFRANRRQEDKLNHGFFQGPRPVSVRDAGRAFDPSWVGRSHGILPIAELLALVKAIPAAQHRIDRTFPEASAAPLERLKAMQTITYQVPRRVGSA